MNGPKRLNRKQNEIQGSVQTTLQGYKLKGFQMGLDIVEHIMLVEDEFKIRIPDEEANKLLTVGAWEDYLSSRLPELPIDTIAQRYRAVVGKLLRLSDEDIANIQRSDRLIEDLNFN